MSMLGPWISNQTTDPYYARKEFDIQKRIIKAEAMVCGLGQFVFYVNGGKISDHELDPGWTDYDRLIQYVTFDITDNLHQGRNVLGVEVGNGWYIKNDQHYTFSFPAFMPPNPNPYHSYGTSLPLAVKLIIDYEDYSQDIICGDDTFLVCRHPILSTNVYGSETFDGRKKQNGWNEPGFKDDLWEKARILSETEQPKGKLTNQEQPAIKVIHTYKAQFLHRYENREIYDLSQNIAGILHLSVKGKTGDVVKIYPAEKLSLNGDIDQVAKNWATVDTCITYVVGNDDGWNDYRMKFTYFAGQYLAVEKSREGIEIRNLAGDAITSAWKQDGKFCSDDERYNKIYQMIERTVEANMMSVHTDCPTIERFAWQEPNHLMAPSIMYMKDGKKLWNKFLMDMRTGQHGKDDFFYNYDGKKIYPGDGLVPSQCPCYIPNVIPVPGMGSFYDIIPWGSTCILGTRWHYLFYGDIQIVQDNYEAGKKYLNYLKTKKNEKGFINHGLGDWGNPDQELARKNVETAFLYADAVTLEYFAELLHKQEDKKYFHDFAEQVKENYNQQLLVQDMNGRWCYRNYEHKDEILLTQACEALPLYWNMVPEDKVQDVVQAFRETLMKKSGFAAGEVGLPYIIQTARQYGMNDLISTFITKEEHPSYYAFVLDKMTTLGEYWEKNPRSYCHDMMGHIIEWYYNGIAGIIPDEPGFKKVLIQPFLPKSMNYMECSYHSVQGIIRVKMERKGQHIELEVKVPENVNYKIDRTYLDR